MRRAPAPSQATLELCCPFCGAVHEVEVTALVIRDVRPDGIGWLLEDVTAGPLPVTCELCGAPHIDRDLAPVLARRLDRLTLEDFK